MKGDQGGFPSLSSYSGGRPRASLECGDSPHRAQVARTFSSLLAPFCILTTLQKGPRIRLILT